MSGSARKTFSLFFFLIFALLPVSEAAEWSVESTTDAREEVDDNLELTPAPHSTVRQTVFAPSVDFGGELENLALHGGAGLALHRFDGESGLDSDDLNFNLTTRIDASERTTWTVAGGYLVDSTLESELTNTGIVLQRTQRNNSVLTIGWKERMFENTMLNASYQAASTAYMNAPYGLFNNHVDSGSAGFTHEINEKKQVNGTLSYSVYRIPDQNYLTWDAGIQIGGAASFSERFRGSLSGGIHQSGSTVGIPGGSLQTLDSGWVFDSGLDYQIDRGALHGGYSRSIQISGEGSLVQVDHLAGSLTRSMTERSSATLGADLYQTLPLREDFYFLKSHYGQIRGGWNWQWTEHWELGAGYAWSAQKTALTPQIIASNAVYVTIVWNMPKWAFSR